MKKIFSIIIFLFAHHLIAQTNVIGGIYANTTWTIAGSPYIIIDSVVVFPGVTLIIEPGVVVKFADNKVLEIRQGNLIAVGTPSDSITFTSNSSSPIIGNYRGVYFNSSLVPQVSYCNFYYARDGLICSYNANIDLLINHCTFRFNVNGIEGNTMQIVDSCNFKNNSYYAASGFKLISNSNISNNENGIGYTNNIVNCIVQSNSVFGIYESDTVVNCLVRNNSTGLENPRGIISNCTISLNQYGIHNPEYRASIVNCIIDSNTFGIQSQYNFGTHGANLITGCQINYNTTGFYDAQTNFSKSVINNIFKFNQIGILLSTANDTFYCNTICDNFMYDVKYVSGTNTNCIAHNFWCNADSTTLAATIFDGYDDPTCGLISYLPIDSVPCVNTIGIDELSQASDQLIIFPNPVSDKLTIKINSDFLDAEVKIFDMLGNEMESFKLKNEDSGIDVLKLTNGVYIIELRAGNKWIRNQFVKI